jgi:beta-lactamase superfamily II metal-dependent hydrolase
MTKRQRKKLIPLLAVLALLLLGALLPSLKAGGIPGWDEIFGSAGLRSGSTDGYPLSVHFIDVGQGDCSLVKTQGAAVLIDGGEKGNDKAVVAYLKNQGVTQIDYLIATHPDSDHIGSLADIIAQYPPKNVIMPKLSEKNTPSTKTYTRLLEAIKGSGAKVIAAVPGNSYTIGGAELQILAPLAQYDDTNNMSVVTKITYGSVSFLMTGDAETASEKAMLSSGEDLRADVLKVGHHGSSTSSGKEFLAAVKPSVAVISCGEGNSYGHPNQKTLSRLGEIGAKVYRTDLLGSIVLATDGKELISSWEKN